VSDAEESSTRSLLVVFESAVAVMLFDRSRTAHPEFGCTANVDSRIRSEQRFDYARRLAPSEIQHAGKRSNCFQQLERRVAGLPGVEAVGFDYRAATQCQLTTCLSQSKAGRPSRPTRLSGRLSSREPKHSTHCESFAAGTDFTEQEVRQSDKVIIVSQQLVERVFPNEEHSANAWSWDWATSLTKSSACWRHSHRSLQLGHTRRCYMPSHDSG